MTQTKTQLVASPLNLNGADLTFPSTQGSADQFLKNGSTAGTLEFATHRGFTTYAIICDQKADSDNGGDFTNGAWRTRNLNTEIADPDNIVVIASDQFTLQAGSYLIEASAPAYKVNNHQTRLYNATTSSVVQYGKNAYSDSTENVADESVVVARVTITGATAFEIQHRASATKATNGFGNTVSGFGGVGIFTVVKIFKEA